MDTRLHKRFRVGWNDASIKRVDGILKSPLMTSGQVKFDGMDNSIQTMIESFLYVNTVHSPSLTQSNLIKIKHNTEYFQNAGSKQPIYKYLFLNGIYPLWEEIEKVASYFLQSVKAS